MPKFHAVLFDFGGTLYDYATLALAEQESLVSLVRWAGVEAEPASVLRAQRDAMRRVFRDYLTRSFYLHRDLFRDAVVAMLDDLGARVDVAHLERYRALQWELHKRDFALRDGVRETLAAIRARGIHLGIVSNIDEDQLAHLLAISELQEYFDSILSSERAGCCKPELGIFAEAIRRAGCHPSEALFVGDTIQQDIAGANRAGLHSVLLWHRDDRDPPDVEPRPHHVIRKIPDVLELL
jgi:HAD superfamily hydrolase (TIGR01662 family)